MDSTQSFLGFYGLREQPFAATADPLYFYATREHKACLFRLWNSIDERHGIAVILGNYGTGKTTLLRKLLTGMAANRELYNAAVLGSPIPSWTSFALLEAVVGQFGIQPPKPSFGGYMEALNRYLLTNRDRINTLIIDDAQNLNKRGQLELLRLVQNLETHQHKLLNLVLFAQLEWIDVLRAAPNFEQRINMTYTLREIQRDELREFIEFRLQQAGSPPELMPAFEDGAVDVIYAYAEGNPRVIVTLCRNALLVASQLRSRRVGPDVVFHTIEKTTVPNPEKRARAAAAVREAMAARETSAAREGTAAREAGGTMREIGAMREVGAGREAAGHEGGAGREGAAGRSASPFGNDEADALAGRDRSMEEEGAPLPSSRDERASQLLLRAVARDRQRTADSTFFP